MKLYSITTFHTERRIVNEKNYFGAALSVSWKEMEDGETQGIFTSEEEADEAFSRLDARVSLCPANGKGWIVEFESVELEEVEVDDDDYDPNESLLDNIIKGETVRRILKRVELAIADQHIAIDKIHCLKEER